MLCLKIERKQEKNWHKIETRITLRATVRSWAEKEEAERTAWSSPGILTVDNRIEIDTEIYVQVS